MESPLYFYTASNRALLIIHLKGCSATPGYVFPAAKGKPAFGAIKLLSIFPGPGFPSLRLLSIDLLLSMRLTLMPHCVSIAFALT